MPPHIFFAAADPAEETAEGGVAIFFPAVYDIIWGGIIFLVLFLFMWKFVLPRVAKVLDDRADKIEGGIARAQAVEAEAAKSRDEHQALLADARAEAARIRETARQEGQTIIAELREQAQREADRITAAASAQIEAERQSALVSLRGEVGGLALGLAGGVVERKLDDDQVAQSIVDNFLAELEAHDASGAAK